VADAALDVVDLADQLGIEQFSVVGRSGGGPHALACAALIDSRRVQSVAVLVGLAPIDALGLDWFDGMTDSNTNAYEKAVASSDALVADLTQRAEEVRRNPDSLLSALEKEMSDADKRIVFDVGIRLRLLETYREALSPGPFGWIDDVLAFQSPWGFALDRITVPVSLWHGHDDAFSPPAHSIWMAGQIPGAKIQVQRGAAHFGAVEILPKVLARLRMSSLERSGPDGAGSEGLRVKGTEQPPVLA
jgi:pimeloyl-ACP methyl ester carboxylesterase